MNFNQRINKKWGLVLLIGMGVVYLFPMFVQFSFSTDERIKSLSLAMPRILSGDVPHYLVMVYSLVEDKDLRLKNNYEDSLYRGAYSVGYNYRYHMLRDHHVRYINEKTGQNLGTTEIFSNFGERLPKNKDVDLTEFEEYPVHPPGMPFFASLFLWPFGHTPVIEWGCVLLTWVLMVIGLFFLFKTLKFYMKDTGVSFLITIFFAFGTQLWYYSMTFYPESYVTSFLIIAYYLFMVKKKSLMPGILLGLSFSMKFPSLLLVIPFGIHLLLFKNFKRLILFSIPVILSIGAIMLYHNLYFGHLFSLPFKYVYHNIWEGLPGTLFSPNNGLFIFSPFLIFSFFGIRRFYRGYKQDAVLLYSLSLIYYIFWSTPEWEGGDYSARYLVPLILLLAIPFSFWYKMVKPKVMRVIFICLLILSVIINTQAALFRPIFVGNPPWQMIYLIMNRFNRVIEILS